MLESRPSLAVIFTCQIFHNELMRMSMIFLIKNHVSQRTSVPPSQVVIYISQHAAIERIKGLKNSINKMLILHSSYMLPSKT